jgi:hypothetical protein
MRRNRYWKQPWREDDGKAMESGDGRIDSDLSDGSKPVWCSRSERI